MAHPPDARAPANANSGTAVGIHAEAGREPKGQWMLCPRLPRHLTRCPPTRPPPSSARSSSTRWTRA
eukprot:2085053-Alexandrium_andersonii.AAC.1